MSILDNVTVEDATADEAKVSRTRASKPADAGVVALLKATKESGTPKKITLPDEASVTTLKTAVKKAAEEAGIGYRFNAKGLTVYVSGAAKKNYVLTPEGAAARKAKSEATRLAKKAEASKPAAPKPTPRKRS